MIKFGFTDTDLTFLGEYIDAHLDDVQSTVHQLEDYKSKLPKSVEGLFDTTIAYLKISYGALEKARLDLDHVNYNLFAKNPIKGRDDDTKTS